MNERAGEASDGDGVDADQTVADGQERDHELLAVGLADVLPEDARGIGRRVCLRTFGESNTGLPDERDAEAGDGVGTGWVESRHVGWWRRGARGRPRLPSYRPVSEFLRNSSTIHALTLLVGSAEPSTGRR